MEIIVNSETFANKIEQAFAVDAHCIQWHASDGTIIFGTKQYQSDVIFSVEKRYATVNETKTFNNLGMAKLLFFLKQLKEQPIKLTIDEDEIKVEGAVIYF